MNHPLGRGTVLLSYAILVVGAALALFPLSLIESKRNPFDHLAGLDRLVTPALHQSQQRIRIRPKFFQGLAVNAGRHSSHKPARLAHFNDNYQSGVLIKGDERAAQVINLGHAEPPSLSSSDDDARPPPLAP
jgi:hypothetical protein